MDSVTDIFKEFHRRRAENIAKAFGVDYADIQKSEDGESLNDLICKGVIEIDDELEKAVYADTPQNRKLGRVGQEYHRGKGGQKDDRKNPPLPKHWGKPEEKNETEKLSQKLMGKTYTIDNTGFRGNGVMRQFGKKVLEGKVTKVWFDKNTNRNTVRLTIGSRHLDLFPELLNRDTIKEKKADVSKAYDDDLSKAIDNPFDAAAEEDIEKSDIMEAISYDENFRISKTGKEIKEQIQNVILPQKQAELAVKKSEADDLLEECGAAPTSDVCRWWCGNMEIDCGYKAYNWEETCMKCDRGGEVYSSLSYENQEDKPKCNCPQTVEEAKARKEYNDKVNIICNILVDIKACDILMKNLDDDATIKLTPRQIIAFDFD